MPERSAVVKEALKRFKLSVEADGKQREREIADLKFQVPEHQWDGDARLARGPATIDGVTIPARPMLAIPKLDQPIQLVLNQERAAHLGVTVDPISEDADDDTAEVIQDLYRRIERDSRAGLARSWAFDRAVKCGRGAYRVNTRYCDDTGNPFDQDITIERLLYQSSARFDPFAQEPDWSDGEWAFVESWMPWEKYQREYDKSDLAKGGDSELEALAEEAPGWVKTDGTGDTDDEGGHAILVAEYWRKTYTEKTWVVLDDGSFSYDDEIPKGRTVHADPELARKRKLRVPKVEWSTINGREELEPTQEWNGKYIPIIPVIGRELQPFDKERYFVGIIGPAKDAQRMFNYAVSNSVETAALEPRSRFHIYEGQDEGYEAMWAQANLRNFPLLKTRIVPLPGGGIAPPPTLLQTDTSKLAMSMQLMQEADGLIQASTSTFDPSLGRLPTKDRSGKAILALQEQSDAGNSHYLHNLAAISMTYEAKVVIDLMSRIYDRPGRIARLLDFEDNPRSVILNQPFTTDEKGKPQPIKPNGGLPANAKHYDLRKGSYGVSVTIGKSWQTRLQQGEAEIGQILQSNPGLMPLVGPTYFKFRDFPGSKEIAELLKKMRAQQYPFLEQKDGEQPDAEQLQTQIQSMGQQMQAMQQQLQQAGQIIQTEQVKQAAQVEIAKAKAQADVQIEHEKMALQERLQQMKDATAIRMKEIDALIKGVVLDQEQEHEALALGQELQHEQLQAAADRSHDWDMAEEAHGRAQQMAEQGHAQTLEQAEQQAALTPPPHGQPGEPA